MLTWFVVVIAALRFTVPSTLASVGLSLLVSCYIRGRDLLGVFVLDSPSQNGDSELLFLTIERE